MPRVFGTSEAVANIATSWNAHDAAQHAPMARFCVSSATKPTSSVILAPTTSMSFDA